MHLFFDFVETHMLNDYIGWFLALKRILKGHASLWSGLGDFYLVFLEFGVWSLHSRVALCIMHLCFKILDLLFAIFFFCLIWMGLQIEAYFERSCKFVDRGWGFLLCVFGIILCNVNVGELGV
jgi:hypothetical protein